VRRLFTLLLTLFVSTTMGTACLGKKYPGSEIIGTFEFTAFVPSSDARPPGTCDFSEMPSEDFVFTGTFSRNPDGKTFFTLGDKDRAATFDGQIISSSQSAPRLFDECNCPDDTEVDETLTVALLSRSQTDRLSDPTRCPADPLGAGVPPVGGDVTGPGSTGSGFDAVLACGTLTDNVVVKDSCPTRADGSRCEDCGASYAVQGARR
jgi:hypothetical protein